MQRPLNALSQSGNTVLAMKRYGKKHWYPFLLSLALEYFAYQNMSESIASSSTRGSTEVEKQELAKRRKAFWLYFLRGPVWEGWTKSVCPIRVPSFERAPVSALPSL